MGIESKMNDQEKSNLRAERLSLLIGTMLGQIATLLNQLRSENIHAQDLYHELCDLNTMAALQVHELFYKDKQE